MVSVYVSAPLCSGAKGELARHGARTGDVRVGVSCLPDAETKGGGLDLAVTGANARRATEDSTTVGYVEAPGREAAFARPILEEADIALLATTSGAEALTKIFGALESRGEKTPREAVSDS